MHEVQILISTLHENVSKINQSFIKYLFPVSHSEFFWSIKVHISTACFIGTEGTHHGLRPFQKNFRI